MNIKVIVAIHKPYAVPEDHMYLPLHVGAEGKTSLGYTGDNTGINISAKNPLYCELTGLYWVWKNLKCDAAGLVHYRRYFGRKKTGNYLQDVIQEKEIESILKECDIIVPKRSNYYIEAIESHFRNHLKLFTKIDYIAYMKEAVRRIEPDYTEALERCFHKKTAYMCNMFIMRKEIFDRYCSWLFQLLEWMEENHSNFTDEQVMPRIYGFIGEIFFNVWLEKNQFVVKEYPIITLEDRSKLKKGIDFCKRKFLGIK